MKKLASTLVQYIAASSELTSRLQRQLASHEAEKAAAAAKITTSLQALLDAGCVKAGQQESARSLLAKHASALDLTVTMATKIASLAKAATEKSAAERAVATELGAPEVVTSPAAEEGANIIGLRFQRQKTAADRSYLEILNPPKTV
jgi:hypothetical protein